MEPMVSLPKVEIAEPDVPSSGGNWYFTNN